MHDEAAQLFATLTTTVGELQTAYLKMSEKRPPLKPIVNAPRHVVIYLLSEMLQKSDGTRYGTTDIAQHLQKMDKEGHWFRMGIKQRPNEVSDNLEDAKRQVRRAREEMGIENRAGD